MQVVDSARAAAPNHARHIQAVPAASTAKRLKDRMREQIFLTTYARWVDGDLDNAEMARLEASIVPKLSPGTTGTGPVS